MLDGVMRKVIDPALRPAGRALARLGVTAEAVTGTGLAVGLLGAVLIAFGLYLPALVLIGLSRLLDGLDGAVARATEPTAFGGYFDIAADFLFYGAVPAAFIIADPAANGVAGAVLLLSFYFNGASFLGYAILAEKQGMSTEARGHKTLYFTGGLMEGTETIALFAALCLWPQYFVWMAFAFAAATFATGIARLVLARRVFAAAPQMTDKA